VLEVPAMKIPGADEAIEHLASWARRGRWKEECARTIAEHFEPVCAKIGLNGDDLAQLLGEDLYSMVETCAFEDFLASRVGPRGRNIVDDYLDQRGWKESIQGRDYLHALRASVLSVYEVIEVNLGRSLILRDLIRGGAPIEVDERLGSLDAIKWDRLAARVLAVGDRRFLSGAVLHVPHEPAESIRQIFRAAVEKTRLRLADLLPSLTEESRRAIKDTLADTTVALEGGARAITSVWLAYTVNKLTAPLPHLTNFDGEAVTFVTVRFPLHHEHRDEVTRLLDDAAELERERSRKLWTWKRLEAATGGVRPADGFSIVSRDDSGALIMGRVELRKKWLVLQVNSKERAERGIELLRHHLRGLLGKQVTETQSVENALAESRERCNTNQAADPIPPEEGARVTREFLDHHYRHIINEPVPAVRSVSPRDAVRLPEGREKVISWLKFLENGERRRAREHGETPYDFTWMWHELGVLEERG
jgi:hypothetical protein